MLVPAVDVTAVTPIVTLAGTMVKVSAADVKFTIRFVVATSMDNGCSIALKVSSELSDNVMVPAPAALKSTVADANGPPPDNVNPSPSADPGSPPSTNTSCEKLPKE